MCDKTEDTEADRIIELLSTTPEERMLKEIAKMLEMLNLPIKKENE